MPNPEPDTSDHRVDDPAAVLAARGASGTEETEESEISSAGSSFTDPQTAIGGADAVPDTPDGVPEDNIGDTERGDFARRGQDADYDRQDGSATDSGSDVSPDPRP